MPGTILRVMHGLDHLTFTRDPLFSVYNEDTRVQRSSRISQASKWYILNSISIGVWKYSNVCKNGKMLSWTCLYPSPHGQPSTYYQTCLLWTLVTSEIFPRSQARPSRVPLPVLCP